jgi:hypothetical protein
MKKNSLLVLLFAFTFAVSSCKKDDDPAPPPVVGVWELDRLEISDMPAAYSGLNGAGYDNNYFLYYQVSRIEVKNDKTFTETYKSTGLVSDYDGTWEFTNNTLNLNYSDTDIDDISLTYDPTKMRLFGEKRAVSDSLTNPNTQQGELVRFSIQDVFVKK